MKTVGTLHIAGRILVTGQECARCGSMILYRDKSDKVSATYKRGATVAATLVAPVLAGDSPEPVTWEATAFPRIGSWSECAPGRREF